MLIRILFAVSSLTLAACAQQPTLSAASADKAELSQSKAEEPAQGKAAASEAEHAAQQNLPKQDLTEAVLYEYLLAEIAGQRGAVGLSAQAYADLAKQTRDPRIAKRAAEVALYARMPAAAIDAARIWYETELSSLQALQALTSLLIGAKREEEALPY
ncbi:MAG: hypothetical protein MUP61_04475, partial [Burkholderiales bacterium]|nr:hypothetical protein [Burkholderiales bacterium]